MKYKILFVDDEPANLRLLERLFNQEYEVVTAGSGAEGLEVLSRHDVAIIISDQRMPGMTGVEFLKRAAEQRANTVRFVLTAYTDVEALVDAINSGVVYKYLAKPWNNADLRQAIRRGAEHYETLRSRAILAQENERLKVRNRGMLRGYINLAMELLSQKGGQLTDHSRRTAGYAAAIGRSIGLDSGEVELLYTAALLHEVAHVRMPPQMLVRNAPLAVEELSLVREQLQRGVQLIAEVPGLEDVAVAIMYHHDHFDGHGSLNGLTGDRIPLHSRILAIADAYDRMRHPCTVSAGFTHEEALHVLQSAANRLYDPDLVKVFCSLGVENGRPVATEPEDEDETVEALAA